MSSDYLAALARIARADEEVAKLAHALRRFAENLERYPEATCFVDVENEPAPPLDELISGGRWYAPDFPTPDSLQSALRERWDARNEAKRVWEKMTRAQRSGAPRIPA